MKTIKYLNWFFFAASLGCLAGGYALAGWLDGVLAALGWAVFWLVTRRLGWQGWPSVVLAAYLMLAVGGVLLGAPPEWLLAGAVAALASWDLAGHAQSHPDGDSHPLETALAQRRARSLGLAVGMGLLMSEAGLLIHVQLHFGAVAAAVLLVLFGLYRFFQLIKRG